VRLNLLFTKHYRVDQEEFKVLSIQTISHNSQYLIVLRVPVTHPNLHGSGYVNKLFKYVLRGLQQFPIYLQEVSHVFELNLDKVLIYGLIHVLHHLLDDGLAHVCPLLVVHVPDGCACLLDDSVDKSKKSPRQFVP